MPQLERMLVIPSPSIHIGIDFEEPKTKLEGSLGLSARIGTLLRVGLTVAIPALKWFLKWTKQQEKTAALQNRAEKKSAAKKTVAKKTAAKKPAAKKTAAKKTAKKSKEA